MTASSRKDIHLRQKLGLVIFGFVLAIIGLEAALRLGGFIISSRQAHRNALAMQQKGAYRIMCIGESTTQEQYPALLELALNERNPGMRFSVIDRGFSGTNTSLLLHRLESDLDTYHPDMVVAMMGINDNGHHMLYESETSPRIVRLIRTLRTYKLAGIAWQHIASMGRRTGDMPHGVATESILTLDPKNEKAYVELGNAYKNQGRFAAAVTTLKRALEIDPRDDNAYVGLGNAYRAQGRITDAAAAFKRALEINPKNGLAYAELGELYHSQDRFTDETSALERALKINPRIDWAYLLLGSTYRAQGRFADAAATFKRALEINPGNHEAYLSLESMHQDQSRFAAAAATLKQALKTNPRDDKAHAGLGELYQAQGRFADATSAFKRALRINPRNARAYLLLGGAYRAQGRFADAAAALKRALDIDPSNDRAYAELGALYQSQGRFADATSAFKRALKINPRDDRAYLLLGSAHRAQGRFAEAAAALKRALEIDPRNGWASEELGKVYQEQGELPIFSVADNYRRLKEILDRRGVMLVCMQYPMRSMEPLKNIFQGRDGGIIFVDNEKIFKDAVKSGSLKDYFTDLFAGDFGHCTPKGNKLLAGNIADVLSRELWKERGHWTLGINLR